MTMRSGVPRASFLPRRLTRMMNAHVPGAVQILAELGLRNLPPPAPRRHAADHSNHTQLLVGQQLGVWLTARLFARECTLINVVYRYCIAYDCT